MTARLHVLLGSGGVGKTTLAAGYALALARTGARVGLLGIDPSRRLQDALGVALTDRKVAVPGAFALHAAVVEPHRAIERWVAEACDDDARTRLERNPFFAALGDRLATATDVLAAVRVAEWAEHDPALTDLIVDTAPGVAALDFLRSPRQLAALVEGRMIRWLRAAAAHGPMRSGARVLGALSFIAGARLVLQLAEFFALVRAPLERMLARVERARDWLASDATELLLVTSPRDTGAAGALQLAAALRAEHLVPRAVIVNRTWPGELADQLAAAVPPTAESPAAPFVAYARAHVDAQAQVIAAAATISPTVIALPALALSRRPALGELGAALAGALVPEVATRSAS